MEFDSITEFYHRCLSYTFIIPSFLNQKHFLSDYNYLLKSMIANISEQKNHYE